MVFIQSWDETFPSDTQLASMGADDIRRLTYAVRERDAVDHYRLAVEAADPKIGYHKFATLIDQAGDPLGVPNATRLYSKTISGKIELFLVFSDNTVVQLTSNGGKTLIENLYIAGANSGDMIYYDGTKWTKISRADLISMLLINLPIAGAKNSFSNLKVSRPSVSQVTVTADEVIVSDTSNNKASVYSVNVTADITVLGSGGLDVGPEANIWYYVFVIRKSSDGTVSSLISASPTIPTMPAGYDQKALVSAVHNTSGDFVDFTQIGKDYFYKTWQTAATGNVGVASWTLVDVTAYIPSGVSELANVCAYDSAESEITEITNDNTIALVNTASQPNIVGQMGDGNGWSYGVLDIRTANTLWWCSNAGSGRFFVTGFKLSKLG